GKPMASTAKIALVTGAGTGVGRAVSKALAREGYHLVLTGRRREPLEEVAREITAGQPEARAVVIPADVGKPAAVEELFDQIEKEFGRLDLLFNNAGTGAPPVPIEELPVEEWQKVVDANITGAFLCSRLAFRLMKKQQPRGGRIINNGSISAHAPRPHSAPYTATKHAITGLTKSCALDGRDFDIAVGQIDIGNAATPMTERIKEGALQPDGSMKPEARIDPEHVANAVVYM